MTNNSNIYDVDSNLIRKAGDNHRWTIEEARDRVQRYQEKIQEISQKENPTEDELKLVKIYENYCKNLMEYEWQTMMHMNKAELASFLAQNTPEQPEKSTEEQVNDALNDLQNDISTGENTQNEVLGTITPDSENNVDEEHRDADAIDGGDSDVHEEKPVSQQDFLVEREDTPPTVMDEYVQYEEVA